MGVKDLWPILDSVKEEVHLSELRGKVLAVDLAGWLCELDSGTRNCALSTLYLRNLFFRISAFLRAGVDLVFITEGRAPALKSGVIVERRSRFREPRSCPSFRGVHLPPAVGKSRVLQRRRLNTFLRDYTVLIKSLGLSVLQSDGEGEALCATLNARGVVDGVISADGDTFLYGATCVYRGFKLHDKDPAMFRYSMRKIRKDLNLSRTKLVAFALFTGCDYRPEGVPMIGKEKAFHYLKELPDEVDVLNRLQKMVISDNEWVGDEECKLDEKTTKLEKIIAANLKTVRNFPDMEVVDEFLQLRKCPEAEIGTWRMPSFEDFHKFMTVKAMWTPEYTVSKIFPLITFWYLNHGTRLGFTHGGQPRVKGIFRERVRNGVPCYEVQWEKMGEDRWTQQDFYMTIEERQTVDRVFPLLRQAYLASTAAAKAEKKRLGAKKKDKPKEDKSKPETEEGEDENLEIAKSLNSTMILFSDDDEEESDGAAAAARGSSAVAKEDEFVSRLSVELRKLSFMDGGPATDVRRSPSLPVSPKPKGTQSVAWKKTESPQSSSTTAAAANSSPSTPLPLAQRLLRKNPALRNCPFLKFR